MKCYIVRHGKDDESIRGGWSNHPLTEEGIRQMEELASTFSKMHSISMVSSSDLPRAMQSAEILAAGFSLPVIPRPEFREVNNGDLAGMKNSLALEKYPGLFWNQLEWEQCYPGGESPKAFYERICVAWSKFSRDILSVGQDVVLVTHGGVIHVIRAIIENRTYSNRDANKKVNHGEMITLSFRNGAWKEDSSNQV